MTTQNTETRRIKESVKEAYTKVLDKSSGCCSDTCCSSESNGMHDKEGYDKVEGYIPEADYGLGCGIPTNFAGIKKGDTVLDLGSGAGNDVFIASNIVGESGRVIGVDFTEAMIRKANENKLNHGIKNVEFIYGDIENIPVKNSETDVVLSNCVLNLVTDKAKAYSEIYRVLKKGGHFVISDIVTTGSLPDKIRESAELYAGCISGAIDLEEYSEIISKAGFTDVQIYTLREIKLPESILQEQVSKEELQGKILSITIGGRKR